MATHKRFLYRIQALPEANFGGLVTVEDAADLQAFVAALEAEPEALPQALNESQGLLLLKGLNQISSEPELLVRLSRLFGPEVENYHQTLTVENRIHDSVPEILVLADFPPSNRQPPPRPDPPLTENGELPVQFPQRRGWHTDQSFRRPPPDISLFYAVIPAPKGQGQTIYANGIAAYESLPEGLKKRVLNLQAIHAIFKTGRSEQAVKAGETPKPLLPHQKSQRQPVVRIHPQTGKRALYLCEAGQMDWVIGPFVGMPPGPGGEGAQLLYELMTHYTKPEFTYTHDWDEGDLIIYDNRTLIHCATWYDAAKHSRLMWRTTVMGNPGEEYAGEKKSWIPDENVKPMSGLDD